MSKEEKAKFLQDVKYFWQYRGDIERCASYSIEEFREADPAMAAAYERMKEATEIFDRLVEGIKR